MYKESKRIIWEEQCKYATRPNDVYHQNLLNNSIKTNKQIEMIEKTETIIDMNNKKNTLPGTPRRRRRSEFV